MRACIYYNREMKKEMATQHTRITTIATSSTTTTATVKAPENK